ncbi:transposase [Kitasatospora aureofaciens]|nr:transposase [Kitasatospora aureofaciens]
MEPTPGHLSGRPDQRPLGEARSQWDTPVTRVRFAARHCNPCELRTSCTSAETGRNLTLRPRTEYDILQTLVSNSRPLAPPLRTPSRRRRHHLAGSPGVRPAQIPLPPLQDQVAAPPHWCCRQLRPHRCLAQRQSTRQDPRLAIRIDPPRWMRSSGAELTNSVHAVQAVAHMHNLARTT